MEKVESGGRVVAPTPSDGDCNRSVRRDGDTRCGNGGTLHVPAPGATMADSVLANQKKIMANQNKIMANQKTIIANQKKILAK